MPENKNQNINSDTSSSSQSTASGSGTSSQNIASGLEKKLDLFLNEYSEGNMEKYVAKCIALPDKKIQSALIRFWVIRDLINYERGKFSSNGKNTVKRQNFLTDKELELAESLLTAQIDELEIYGIFTGYEEAEGTASTSEGKEVIKAEISQELEKAKKNFDNLQISQVKHETIKNEITEKLLELHERIGGEAAINLLVDYNRLNGFFDSKVEAQKKRKAKAEKVAEAVGKTVMRAVSDTITDLEAQKNKISKKVGKLIEARNQEVIEAREVIRGLETLHNEALAKNKDLKQKSDREISNLQAAIKKLNNELKEFQNKGEQYKKFTQKNIERIIERPNLTKEKMTNEEEKLKAENKELKENLTTALNASEFYRLAEEQKTLELKNLQDTLEREKNRLNADLETKENELERERKIFLDRQKELSEQIKQLKNKKQELERKIDEKDEELEQQQPTINRLRTEKETLQAELAKTQNEKQDLETKYEALTKKSLFYQACDKLGIVSFKNSISNASMIAGAVVILYAISWMWKNLLKPTYRNFKGDSEDESKNKEPQSTPINNNQPPIIHIVKDYPRPIEVETPKPIVEKVRKISPNPEKFSPANPDEQKPERENFPSTPKNNSKKGKATKKKPKNKK